MIDDEGETGEYPAAGSPARLMATPGTARPPRGGWATDPWDALPASVASVRIEDQGQADALVGHLLQAPAASRVLYLEPLRGPINLMPWLAERLGCPGCGHKSRAVGGWDRRPDGRRFCPICDRAGVDSEPLPLPGIDWVVVAGGAGPDARPCHLEWIRFVVAQCRKAGTPVYVKRLGSYPMHRISPPRGDDPRSGIAPWPVRDPDGGDPAEWPEDLRVREFPKGGES